MEGGKTRINRFIYIFLCDLFERKRSCGSRQRNPRQAGFSTPTSLPFLLLLLLPLVLAYPAHPRCPIVHKDLVMELLQESMWRDGCVMQDWVHSFIFPTLACILSLSGWVGKFLVKFIKFGGFMRRVQRVCGCGCDS